MVATAHASKRVLVIEDNICTRESLSMMLGSLGYQVAAAANGQDALQRLKTFERPGLILLDLSMPGMDGRAFCEQQKLDKELASIPVIIISSASDIAEKAASLGAAACVQKPFDAVQLIEIITRHCKECSPAHT